jgi:hypothetical protein
MPIPIYKNRDGHLSAEIRRNYRYPALRAAPLGQGWLASTTSESACRLTTAYSWWELDPVEHFYG